MIVGGLLLALIVVVEYPILRRSRAYREHARRVCCASNLRQIGLCVRMYRNDYDDRLPPGRSLQDLVGEQWSGRPIIIRGRRRYKFVPRVPGPLFAYSRNAVIHFCPSDPANGNRNQFPYPGISYRWDRTLGGKLVSELDEGWRTKLLWERQAWHNGGMNIGYLDGHVSWQP